MWLSNPYLRVVVSGLGMLSLQDHGSSVATGAVCESIAHTCDLTTSSEALSCEPGSEPEEPLTPNDVADEAELPALVVTDDIPLPPALMGGPASASTFRACPVELRAIVLADDSKDSFALASIRNESQFLRAGTRFELGGLDWKVVSIGADVVVFRHGDKNMRCRLRR